MGLSLFIKPSRGRGFYLSPIRNVTIIFVVAVGSCIRGGKKKRRQVHHGESVSPADESVLCADLWRTAARLRAAPARQTLQIQRFRETGRRGDRKHSCKLVSIRGYIGSR